MKLCKKDLMHLQMQLIEYMRLLKKEYLAEEEFELCNYLKSKINGVKADINFLQVVINLAAERE